MNTEPQKEHEWLQKLVGEWTMESDACGGPDTSAEKSTGTESVRSLGGLWVVAEGQGEMPGGGPATMIMTLGYDPRKQRYVGTWVGSMMADLWQYEGTLDQSGRMLTLETEGPSMTGDGTRGKYRDVIEFVSDDHRLLRSLTLGEDGKWNEFMTAHYRRAG